ncbi:MAG: hypothetical protein IJ634_00580 [Bacteroidales bacterium]|nr:hypothetical protein [Bacteroidales bacterium]
MTYKEHLKKRDWVYVLTLFGVFAVAFFLSALLIDGRTVRYSVVSGLLHGTFFAGMWWLVEALIAANSEKEKK